MARGSNRPLTKSEYQEYLLGVKVIYRIIIVPVVLYGCESWSFTLREERKLRVFWEHGVEENIWTEEGRGNGGMEEIA